MDRCKECGSFVSDVTVENGQARYFCKSCESWILDYRG